MPVFVPVRRRMFSKQLTPAVSMAAAGGLAVVLFIGDLLLPLGVAWGVPYIAVVAMAWWLPRRRHIFVLAFVSSVLILAGYWLSSPGGVYWVVVINRILALFAVWVTAALLYVIRREEWARQRFQKLARETEARLIDALESIEDGVALYDADDRFVFCNSKYRVKNSVIDHMFVPGMRFEDVIRAVTEVNYVTGAADDPETYIKERLLRHQNLEPSLLHIAETGQWVMLREYRTSDGGTLIIRNDITESKKSEEALRENEERLSLILEEAVGGIITIDEKGLVQTLNPAAEKIFGYAPDEVIGRNVSMLMPEPDRSKHDGYLENYHATGDDKIIGIGREVVGLRKNGVEFPMELGISELVLGGKKMFTGFVEDISERKKAQDALLESESRFRDLAETASDWFWEMDRDLRFTYVSERYYEVTGRTPSEIIDKTRSETADKTALEASCEDWDQHRQDLEARRAFSSFVMSNPGARGGQYEGRRYYIRLSGRPRFNGDGEFLGYRGTATDITAQVEAETALRQARDELEVRVLERTRELSEEVEERKRVEADLRQAKEEAEYSNRAKGEFLANMSHELRTPLNSIIGFSDMLKSEIFGAIGNQRYLEYLSDINASGRHLLDLIKDILDVSKIEAGAMDLSDEGVEIAAVAGSCLSMVRERASNAGVRLESDFPADLPEVRGDTLRIKQVLLNLIGNAVKFTPRDGSVSISAEYNDRCVSVIVSDTGVGIAAEDLEHITEPFAQAAHSQTRSHEGTGLGLSLVKTLMELHEGSLEIESELGQGTVAAIRFPEHRTITVDSMKAPA